MATRKPAKPSRSRRGGGALYRKTGYRVDTATGERVAYTYWQAARDVPAAAGAADGKRTRITGSGPTAAEAARRLEANIAAFYSDEPHPRSRVASNRRTVAQLFEEWQQANEDGRVSATMAYKYRGYFENHILPELGRKRADLLTQRDCLMLHNTLMAKLNPRTGEELLGPDAQRNILVALSAALTFGVRQGYIERNIMKSVKLPAKANDVLAIDVPVEEAKELLANVARDFPEQYARWLFQFLGLRRAERLGLMWSDVSDLDTDNAFIVVRHQLERIPEVGAGWHIKDKPKNKKPRKVALVEPWLTALREHKARQDKHKRSNDWKPRREFADLVFLQPDGRIYTLNRDNRDWHRLLSHYGLTYWPAHQNRHITATLLASQQPPPSEDTLRAILGHSSVSMALYYTHFQHRQQVAPLTAYGQMLITPAKPSGRSASRPSRRRRGE